MIKVSFVIPTLGREEGLKRCVESIQNLNYPHEDIEILVIEDKPRMGVPKRVNQGVRETTGEYIVYGANDCEFTPDSLKIALEESITHNKRLVAFNTGTVLPDEGNICEHFLIKRDLIPELVDGQLFCEQLSHCGVDNLLWTRCTKLNEACRSEKAIVNHYHFSKGAEFDEVYQLAWNKESVEKDRETLKRLLAEELMN